MRILLLAALLALPFTGTGGETDFTHLQAIARAEHHRVTATEPDGTYHVYVRVPESYEADGDTVYPTLYILDGGNLFPLLAGYYRYLELGGEVPPLILVGISYGTDYFRRGNQRNRDYTAEAPEPEYWGGADAFRRLLREEVVPLVEARYRSDRARRLVIGQSLGGQFVLHTALYEPTLFWGHIAVNPALHRNLERFLAAPRTAAEPPAERPRVYVASAEHDPPRLRGPALEWIGHWLVREERQWDLQAETLPGETHFSAAPAAFRRGVRWLFGMQDVPAFPD